MAFGSPAHTPKPLEGVCAHRLVAVGFDLGFGVGSFLFNQHIHFSLPTVLSTLAQTHTSFIRLLLALRTPRNPFYVVSQVLFE
jgi:hypothetical protein